MDRAEALDRLGRSPVGHLATITPDSKPHVVPVTFAVSENRVLTMVDHKPKTTHRLQRLTNIREHGTASLLADHYESEWSRLWWVRIDGAATVHDAGPIWQLARDALAAKYSQYGQRPPEGPAINLEIDRVTFWESTP